MGCESCPCKMYPRIGSIPKEHKPILVIKEVPSVVETRRGSTGTDHGSQILMQIMQTVNLPTDEDSLHFTWALKCAIPKKKGQKLPKEALVNCRQYLLDEINTIKPKLVLACGATAMATLTGNLNLKITEEYGRVREYDFIPGVKVVPIMNPGVLMHNPKEYKPFLHMMQLASQIYENKAILKTDETAWTVLDTPEKVKSLWDLMHKKGIKECSMDIETTDLDYRIAEFLVLGICFEKGHTFVIPREMRSLVHNFIEGVPWKCIWQGGKYDKKVMWRRKLGAVSIDEDTMYQHYVLDETSSHDLGYLSKTYLHAEEYKYKMNQNWKSVTLESYQEYFNALCERVAVDCDYTLQLKQKFNDMLSTSDSARLKSLYEKMIIPAANFLSRVEQNGILVDVPYLNEMDKDYVILLAKIKSEVEELAAPFWDRDLYMRQTGAKSGPPVFNPGSPAQMAWMVFDRLKLRPRVKKGRSTDKDILESIDPMPNLVKKVLEFRSVQKEHSTYVLGLLNARDDDGKVRTTFTLHVTATGRLSSKEPNIQNQPSANGVGNIRKAFISEPGRILAEIDYSGAELRWLAFLSRCPVLSEIFIQGRNLHNETATHLFGEHFTKQQKMRAKAVNFGIPYGREAPSLADEFDMPKHEAQKMLDDWNNKYYGAAEYLQWCADRVAAGDYLETPFGRRRRFGLVTSATLSTLQKEGKNFPIQSSSSDLLLDCSMLMEVPLKKEFDTNILNLIHDSDLLDLPANKKIIMEAARYADSVMTKRPVELFQCPIPFKTDFEIGFNWGELVAFNWKTGNVEIENHDDTISIIDFDEWYQKKMEDLGK